MQDHLRLIAEMTREFTASHDYKTIVHSALERITKYVGAEAASLFLVGDTGDTLVCSACYGPVDVTGLRISAKTGVVGRAIQTRQGTMVRDVSADSDFGAMVDAKTGFKTRSLLVAPLTIGDDCLGAIEIINRVGGGDDGLFSSEDLMLLETLARAAALAINNFRLTQKIVQSEREQHELELAAEIQRDLLPQPQNRDFPIHGINIPARSVSGDFFDIMVLPDGRIWFNVGDVSGKGMNAALLMAKTSSLFRCLAKSAEHPGQLLNAINSELCETNSRGMFVTMVGGLFNPSTGRLTLTNAGHEPPLHFDLRTERFNAIPADGPPLGIAHGIAGPDGYPVTELDLAGGMLYVFTDGLTEATTFGGGMLGIDGARALIRDHAEESAEIRLKSISGAVKLPGQSLRDDLTLLVVEDMMMGRAPAMPPPHADVMSSDGEIIRIRVPARPDRLKRWRWLKAGSARCRTSPDAPLARRIYVKANAFRWLSSQMAFGVNDDRPEARICMPKWVLEGQSSITAVTRMGTLPPTSRTSPKGASRPKYFRAMLRLTTMESGASKAVAASPAINGRGNTSNKLASAQKRLSKDSMSPCRTLRRWRFSSSANRVTPSISGNSSFRRAAAPTGKTSAGIFRPPGMM